MSNSNFDRADSRRSIIKSTSLVSLGTLASRLLGFVRDVILARMLGTGLSADAFFVAFKIPNLFRDLVGEGASNAAVVPVLSEYQAKGDRKDFWQLVSSVLLLATMSLSALTLAGIIFSPIVVRIMAPGFISEPQKLQLTISLTRILFPYLILVGLTAHTMAILYTFRKFGTPSFGPCLQNVVMIVGALLAPVFFKDPVYGLALATLVGGVAQMVLQFWSVGRIDGKIQRPEKLLHPGAIQIGRLFLPRMMGAGVYQLTVFIDTFCASWSNIVGPGGISAIYYANRILQFPMGIFGFALASAVLPSLSTFAAQKNSEQFKKTLVFALENIFFVMVPSSLMLILFSEPMIRLLFQRGAFRAYSTDITAWALFWFAFGLTSFGAVKIMVTAFYAQQDTRTPVKVAAGCLLLSLVLNAALMFPMKVGGIALANSITSTVNLLWLLHFMEKRIGRFRQDLRAYLDKVLIAAIVAGLPMYGLWRFVVLHHGWTALSEEMALGSLLYILACYYLKIEQAQKIFSWLSTKKI